MARNKPITYIAIIAAFIFFYSYLLFPSSPPSPLPSPNASPFNAPEQGRSAANSKSHRYGSGGRDGGSGLHVSKETIHGDVIMPKLGNETIKAELGRASWKLLHTMLGRYPEKPSKDEREALKSYIYLFARLYPCGECAAHFRILLQKYPPQTSSRDAASQWGCVVHNAVNQRLDKDIFDCGTIADKYHCGCADEDEKKKSLLGSDGDDSVSSTAAVDLVNSSKGTGRKDVGGKVPAADEEGEMKLIKEGLTRGG